MTRTGTASLTCVVGVRMHEVQLTFARFQPQRASVSPSGLALHDTCLIS